jgi:hypothetical protein
MRALFGYTATPTFVEAAAYIMYWLLVVALFVYRHKKGTLVDKDLSKYEEEESNPNMSNAPATSGAGASGLHSVKGGPTGIQSPPGIDTCQAIGYLLALPWHVQRRLARGDRGEGWGDP